MPAETVLPYRVGPLRAEEHLTGFDCGNPMLNQWLLNRAMRNQTTGASRTYLARPTQGPEVAGAPAGYYSLAASAVALATAPGPIRRNMPDPIPVVLLGRLAPDLHHRGTGLGGALLKDAATRTLAAADTIGVRALLVHAIDEQAEAFYRHFGFIPAPVDTATLFLPLTHLQATLARL